MRAILQQNHVDYPNPLALNENGQIILPEEAMYEFLRGLERIERWEMREQNAADRDLDPSDWQMVLYDPDFYNLEVIFPGYREQPVFNQQAGGLTPQDLPSNHFPGSFYPNNFFTVFGDFNNNMYMAAFVLLGILYLLNNDNELCG